MIKKKMICFRCHKAIEENANFYEFTEWDNKKFIRTDYAHKSCWELFLKSISDTSEAMGIIRGLKNNLINMGMIEPDKVVIK